MTTSTSPVGTAASSALPKPADTQKSQRSQSFAAVLSRPATQQQPWNPNRSRLAGPNLGGAHGGPTKAGLAPGAEADLRLVDRKTDEHRGGPRDDESLERDVVPRWDPSIDGIDPLARALAVPSTIATTPQQPAVPSELVELVGRLVRRVAWGGDGRRGTARLEIGSGELAGATLLVHADDGVVRVDLEVPAGVDPEPWRSRIADRLSARGLSVDEIVVR